MTAISAVVRGSTLAYDYKDSLYLVVSAHGGINAVLVTADGVIGAPFAIQSPAVFSQYPGVAYSPDLNGGAGGFLVTWHQSLASGGTVVHARFVSPTGVLGPELGLPGCSATGTCQVSLAGSWWEAAADIAYSTTSKEFIVTWQGIGILGQRIALDGTLLGTNFPITPASYHRDPAVVYNPTNNEYMVVFGGADGSGAFAAFQRVAAGSGALVGPETFLNRAGAVYITEVAYNSDTNQYLAAWYQGGTYGRLIDASGNIVSSVVPLSTTVTAYDALGIDYNDTSGTFMMVSHSISSFQDGAVELAGATAAPDIPIIATAALPATTGNFYPKIASRVGKAEWLLSTSTGFAATTVHRLQSTATSGPPPPAPLTVAMGANKTSPVMQGTTITWTASASGGTGPHQFQFFTHTPAQGWVLAQAYSGANTLSWAPSSGPATVQVWVRNAGSSAAYDAYTSSSFTITTGGARVTSLTTSVNLPPLYNWPVTWTATATAATAVEYQFMRYTSATGWSIAQAYSPVNTFTWYPPFGTNAVQVWVRRIGSTAAYEDWAGTPTFTLGPSPARLVDLRQNTLLAMPGVPITWTALAAGGQANLEYKFFLYNQTLGSWVVLQDWSLNNQATWTPGAGSSGLYLVQVWVRSVGLGVAYEDWRSSQYVSVSSSSSLILTPNRSLTGLRQGDAVRFTATIGGASGTWEYKFFVYDGTSWSVGANYSTSNFFDWVATAGTRTIEVWVRQVGSAVAYDRFSDVGPFLVLP